MKHERIEALDDIATQLAKAMHLPAGASVLDRIIRAIDIEAHGVIRAHAQEDGWTMATVTSQSRSDTIHTVHMSADQSVVLCSCEDNSKSHAANETNEHRIASFHCKHIIAVKLKTNPQLLLSLFPKPKPVRRTPQTPPKLLRERPRMLPNGYIIER
mgnify:CR=1 FL=1